MKKNEEGYVILANKKGYTILKDGKINKNALKIAMLQRGYESLKDFAPALGINYDSLTSKLRSDRQWTISDIQRIAEVLNLTGEEFVKIFYNKEN